MLLRELDAPFSMMIAPTFDLLPHVCAQREGRTSLPSTPNSARSTELDAADPCIRRHAALQKRVMVAGRRNAAVTSLVE